MSKNSDDDYDKSNSTADGPSQPSDPLSLFSREKYLNLETYRKDARPVVTPVWFTIDGGEIHIVTGSETGKVKRLRKNEDVRVMPCGMRGEPKGQWLKGRGRISTPEELERAVKERKKKYGFQARLAGIFASRKGELIALSIALQ